MKEFKVGDHVKVKSFRDAIRVIEDIYTLSNSVRIDGCVFDKSDLTLCLPEKWAIKTDRQEFWDYYKDYCDTKSSEYYHHFPAFGNLESEFGKYHADIYVYRGYTEITFEYWCRVHRPDLLSCSEIPTNSIPEKWCVRRTPENAEVLNAWGKSKVSEWNIYKDEFLESKSGFITSEGYGFIFLASADYPEITYEQWQTIPEVAEWLKIHFKKEDCDNSCEPEREIIGYKFKDTITTIIKDTADDILKAHLGNDAKWHDEYGEWVHAMRSTSVMISIFKELGVLDLWFEPVYKEDSDRVTCVSAIKKLYRNTAEIANGIVKPFEELTLCLPEKWCVKRTPENADVLEAWFGAKVVEANDWYLCYNKLWNKRPYINHYLSLGKLVEITYEQWQTIPRVAEWLQKECDKELAQAGAQLIKDLTEEEREIEGYKAPFDMYEGEVKKGDVYQKSISDPNLYFSVNYDEYLPAEWVETWEPVYAEAQYEVGQWVTYTHPESKKTETFKIQQIQSNGWLSSTTDLTPCYSQKACRLATPEEIEKAKPVWERFPTWESLDIVPAFYVDYGSGVSEKVVDCAKSFGKLSQIEKAWNEGKEGSWVVVWLQSENELKTYENYYTKYQVNFATKELALKSIELHGDLWRKFWMA